MKICPTCGLEYPDDQARCFVDKAELQPMADPRLGMLLKGRYVIEAVLGEGGMALVYRARNTLVERPVAVKVMNAHLVRDASLKERFRREAKNAAAIAHPNIIAIHDYGETEDGTPFLVMELLDGQPLDTVVEQGPMPAGQVAALGIQIARGLARAHDFSVIHRDLKPENIFLCRDPQGSLGIVKILDFGIARSMHDSRLTNLGEIFGTPQYMAPERVTSTDAGASVDLYALGVILFEMLTGRLPFESNDIPGFLIRHMQDPPPRPSELVAGIPPALEAIILQLLAKKVEDRPVDAHAVMKALEPLVPQGAAPEPLAAPATTQRIQLAPTHPPATLERWDGRAAVFEQMVQRAYPSGGAPPAVIAGLAEIRGILARIGELRRQDLAEQRKLEQLEQRAQESRERLGRAMHVLGEDLSSSREAQREAQRAMTPYFETEAGAEAAYERAQRELIDLGGERVVTEPTEALARAARAMADALERWVPARDAARQAREWLARKAREVTDLEFQVDALRAQLERLEATYEQERGASEAIFLRDGAEMARLEDRLTHLGSSVAEPLRAHGHLSDLFARLEQEGTPMGGVRFG